MGSVSFTNASGAGPLHDIDGLLGVDTGSVLTGLWAQWGQVRFDHTAVADCSPVEAVQGLQALEHVRRSLAAATAVLTTRLAAGRDTRAALTRTTGMSGRDARDTAAVARVCETTPLAVDLLANGDVSAAHVRQLSYVDTDDRNTLLAVAAGQTVDEFTKTVRRHLVDTDAEKVGGRQRAARSVTFHDRADGCIGINIVLPPVEGTEFRDTLDQICDAAYRRSHPQRAETIGGHNVQPRHRRLADALIEWMRSGTSTTGKHEIEYEHGGPTNIENLAPECRLHHPHLHLTNVHLIRNRNGTYQISQPDQPDQTPAAA
jgi:hypothetical protein